MLRGIEFTHILMLIEFSHILILADGQDDLEKGEDTQEQHDGKLNLLYDHKPDESVEWVNITIKEDIQGIDSHLPEVHKLLNLLSLYR